MRNEELGLTGNYGLKDVSSLSLPSMLDIDLLPLGDSTSISLER